MKNIPVSEKTNIRKPNKQIRFVDAPKHSIYLFNNYSINLYI